MASRTFYVFLFLLLTFEASMTSVLGGWSWILPSSWSPPMAQWSPKAAFISESCRATQYPDICYESLLIYADSIAENPVALATHAAEVTAEILGDLSWRLGDLSRRLDAHLRRRSRPAPPPQEAAALHNCIKWAGHATKLVIRARNVLQRLDEGAAAALLMEAKPQKWLNEALTDEDTCADGFEEVALVPGRVSAKEEVLGRVHKVKQYTRNALDLVNSLATSSASHFL